MENPDAKFRVFLPSPSEPAIVRQRNRRPFQSEDARGGDVPEIQHGDIREPGRPRPRRCSWLIPNDVIRGDGVL